MVHRREKENFIYFIDSPMIIDNILIGKIFKEKNQATLIYNLETQDYFINEYKSNSVDFNNICLPIFASKKYIISILDLTVLENLKTKPKLSRSQINHIEEGGRILCLYHLR